MNNYVHILTRILILVLHCNPPPRALLLIGLGCFIIIIIIIGGHLYLPTSPPLPMTMIR